MKKVAVLPGDGIGKEVIEVCIPIINKLGLDINLIFGSIGWENWVESGNPVPDETWQLISSSDAVLLGAVTSKPKRIALEELKIPIQNDIEYISPVIQLRQKLNLFANVRPIVAYGGDRNYEFYIIRENTEGLYSGLDFKPIPSSLKDFICEKNAKFKKLSVDDAATIRIITESGFDRLLKFSSDWAISHGKKEIVIADKPNVFRNSSELIFNLIEKYSKLYPTLNYRVENVDAVAMWMVRRPEKYEVIVCENQFGDILSDVGAAVMGGLGMAYSGNFGMASLAYFEPVHGSAPKYVGLDKANPIAMFLTIAMLVEYLGYIKESQSIKKAVRMAVSNCSFRTFDLSGTASQSESAEYIIQQAVKFNEE
ncbi:isocitrate/isopropylmalate dehydrogenase family protein [Streptococcus gallolyticus]|uniref:isocitrate/isopropylmalate dehydrogenase family protein n=1 Tax=Streptococcus gallolyticus TaxID=315405 RepID=UPI0001E09FF4|nr:isocitrate/isopropylmalate family dehydrogenase [Streptococcus gallolyticus]MCF2566402.1 isocitrate/isopropylmalate dehydrogenase family protein [Streptococcus pasteurianus]EFM28912.1 dehydrogenase, isocitrate/isopropylmalate family [Streptococcus gallolyticus subsp. gallolyticus TX20005]MCY7172963.1 isocitrate/isopropylmalate family dehydrogenase [Streptococcus gallolyticus subsp. gallolyticus]MCY7176992.1 isocitrate/isopropylmalate family dehydrogenase [Streptococcus gallolyticus subsp. ga